MKIGIVTTWFERGAAYVSKTYMDLLINLGHEVVIYARGGDGTPEKGSVKWNESYVTRDNKYNNTQVDMRKFMKWIRDQSLDMILFNEQRHYLAVAEAKKQFPKLIVGAYVDYYTEDTLPLFSIFDFLLCNTRRHLQAMSGHPQAYYLKWGIDTELYKRNDNNTKNDQITFFHSVGMSARKGTDILLDAFIHSKLYNSSKLVIHTQKPIESVCSYQKAELAKYNIEIIEKTVGAPGLYGLGDIYVYPTKLDGLGLTMYEALSFGMPVITTDYPPMNEVITNDVGSLVKAADHYCRADAYYYPMTICDEKDLIEKMQEYIDNPERISTMGNKARSKAKSEYSLQKMEQSLAQIMGKVYARPLQKDIYTLIKKVYCSPIIKGMKQISEDDNRLKSFKSKVYQVIRK